MLKAQVGTIGGRRIIAMDSITKLNAEDEGAIIVAASHGGSSAAEVAASVPLHMVFFNDAGVGKDRAGIVGLSILQEQRLAAGTVSHESACIGDGMDMWEHGVLSHVNAAGLMLGIRPGMALRNALLHVKGEVAA
ncbi:MAG: hypothetical protein ACFB6S_15110 [Geminicoccaceae bacterium]